MAVYVDKLSDWEWRLGPSCHMIADTNEELHEMAAKIGLKRVWFQDKSTPHYDLVVSKRKLAVNLGAVELEDRPFHAIIEKWTDQAVAAIEVAETEKQKQVVRKHLYR